MFDLHLFVGVAARMIEQIPGIHFVCFWNIKESRNEKDDIPDHPFTAYFRNRLSVFEVTDVE